MALVLIFVILVILSSLLLLTMGITATTGASDAGNSKSNFFYSQVGSAHQLLVVAAALAWASLVILVVVLIVAAIADGFPTHEVSKEMLKQTTLNPIDYVKAVDGERKLTSGRTMQLAMIVVLIIVTIFSLTIGIISSVAAGQLASVINAEQFPGSSAFSTVDGQVSSAYSLALTTAILGYITFVALGIGTLVYMRIRTDRKKEAESLKAIIDRTEENDPNITVTKMKEPANPPISVL